MSDAASEIRARDLADAPVRTVSARPSLRGRLSNLWQRRELLGQLIVSDIRVKYKGSALGLFWSMLAPAMNLAIYFLVFSVFLKNGIPNFVIYLFSGLIVWNMFFNAVIGSTTVVIARAGLVKKVSFPREILALSTVGATVVYFFVQLAVLAIFLVPRSPAGVELSASTPSGLCDALPLVGRSIGVDVGHHGLHARHGSPH